MSNRLSVVMIAKTPPTCCRIVWAPLAGRMKLSSSTPAAPTTPLSWPAASAPRSIPIPTGEAMAFSASAQDYATGDWVLMIDTDERVTPELRQAILKVLDAPQRGAIYSIARRNYFLGRFMRHSGWYPDRVLRLYERARYRYNDNLVHESLDSLGAEVIPLTGDLLHLTCRDFAGFQQNSWRMPPRGRLSVTRRARRPRWQGFSAIRWARSSRRCYCAVGCWTVNRDGYWRWSTRSIRLRNIPSCGR